LSVVRGQLCRGHRAWGNTAGSGQFAEDGRQRAEDRIAEEIRSQRSEDSEQRILGTKH